MSQSPASRQRRITQTGHSRRAPPTSSVNTAYTRGPMARLSQVFAPKDREFFDLFEEAAGNISRAGDLLAEMLAGFPESAGIARDILVCEQEGDRITHDIVHRLNQTFVTPIDREDILELVKALDDVVDLTEEVADFLILYKIEAPMEQAQRLAHILRDRSEEHTSELQSRQYLVCRLLL